MGNKNNTSKKDPKILNDADIALIKKRTNLSLEEIKMWHARFLGEVPDGVMDLQKFINIYSSFYPFGNAEKYAKIAFMTFDSDKSGTITFNEFIIATSFGINKAKNNDFQSALEYAFNIYDLDGNGKVDKNELITMMTAMYEVEGHSSTMVDKRVDDILKQFDKDKSQVLDKDEFKSFIITDQIASRFFL